MIKNKHISQWKIDEINHLIHENVIDKNLDVVSALRHQEKFLNTPDGKIYIEETKIKIRKEPRSG